MSWKGLKRKRVLGKGLSLEVSIRLSTGFLWGTLQGFYGGRRGSMSSCGAFDPAQNPRQQDTYDMDALLCP